jgi:hypothetical protein
MTGRPLSSSSSSAPQPYEYQRPARDELPPAPATPPPLTERMHSAAAARTGDRHAAFARRGGNLKANPAAADNRQPRCRCQPLLQTLRVLPVAQGINLRMRRPASPGRRARRRWRSTEWSYKRSPLLSARFILPIDRRTQRAIPASGSAPAAPRR